MVGLVVRVVVVVRDVRYCPRFGIVIHDCLIRIFRVMCGLVGVFYIGLDSFEYNFVGRRVVLLCVMRFLLVLSGFCSKFGSL